MTKTLTIEGREFDPWQPAHFVICPELCASGMVCKFGEQVPLYLDLQHLHVHFANGAIGTKEELEALNGTPVELYQEDPLMPIAKFVALHGEVQTPLQKDDERGVFAMENAGLLKTKDDLIGYAKQFDIVLQKAQNISIKKMLETLEAAAKEKGLIE